MEGEKTYKYIQKWKDLPYTSVDLIDLGVSLWNFPSNNII